LHNAQRWQFRGLGRLENQTVAARRAPRARSRPWFGTPFGSMPTWLAGSSATRHPMRAIRHGFLVQIWLTIVDKGPSCHNHRSIPKVWLLPLKVWPYPHGSGSSRKTRLIVSLDSDTAHRGGTARRHEATG